MTMTKAGKSLFLMLWTGGGVTEVMCRRSNSMDGTDGAVWGGGGRVAADSMDITELTQQGLAGLSVTSSSDGILTEGGSWPAMNALLAGTTCPAWGKPGSVVILGTLYGGPDQQWIKVDLGSVNTVATVKYYGKAILNGEYAGDIQNVEVCTADGTSCSSCIADDEDDDGVFYNCHDKQGRYVRITRTPSCCDGKNWHFCRMKVYTELTGLSVTSSSDGIHTEGGSWPATNALLSGTTCPDWGGGTAKSVVILGTLYGGPAQQWIKVDLGSVNNVATVKYYGKAILNGSYAGDIQNVEVCTADGTSCSSCLADGEDDDGVFYNCHDKQGEYVRITRTPSCCDGKNWHFCRVKVYGAATTTKTTLCPDDKFPWPSGNGVFCYNNASYVNGGPCDSWCTTDEDSGDGCSGCCGDIKDKVCQAGSLE